MIFIVSAVAKMLSADTFEVYLLTLHLFPMGVAFVLARLVIATELAVGALLCLNLDRRFSASAALTMLGAFTLFLIYLVIAGNTDNCHCFGELVDFSPVQSIFKNVAIAALCVTALFAKPFSLKWRRTLQCIVVLASFASVFIISVPDNWRYSSYSKEAFNQDYFSAQASGGALPAEVRDGSRVVCFFSTGCNYCRMASKKLEALISEGRFDASQVIVLFPQSNSDADYSPQQFLDDAGLQCSWHYIGAEQFVRSTSGEMPMIVELRNGIKQAEFGYRDLH